MDNDRIGMEWNWTIELNIHIHQVIGLIYGFQTQQFSKALILYAIGSLLTLVLTIPAWPLYKRNPVKWLPRIEVEPEVTETEEGEEAAATITASSTDE